jgi:hypothetical protein
MQFDLKKLTYDPKISVNLKQGKCKENQTLSYQNQITSN